MDTVDGICCYIDGALKAEGHISSPEIIIDRLRKGYHVKALLPQKIGRFLASVSTQHHQTFQFQFPVCVLHGFYLVDAVLIRLPDGLERNS